MLFGFYQLQAQTDTLHKVRSDKNNLILQLSFHPLALINIHRPTLQGSAEFGYKKLRIEFTYGQRYRDDDYRRMKPDTLTTTFKGHNYRIGLKYFILTDKKFTTFSTYRYGVFIGSTYWNIRDRYNAQVDYGSPATTGFTLRDCYAIKKNVEVFALQGGALFTRYRLGLEACVGIGVRHRIKTLINSEQDTNSYVANPGEGDLPHSGYLPHLNICAKICYRFF